MPSWVLRELREILFEIRGARSAREISRNSRREDPYFTAPDPVSDGMTNLWWDRDTKTYFDCQGYGILFAGMPPSRRGHAPSDDEGDVGTPLQQYESMLWDEDRAAFHEYRRTGEWPHGW